MTYIPTIERIEESQCNVCSQHCTRLCVNCGNALCNKHLFSHGSTGCQEYHKIIRSILRDEVSDVVKHVVALVPRL